MFEVIADQNRPIARFSVQNGKPEIFSKIRESPRVLRDLAFSLTLVVFIRLTLLFALCKAMSFLCRQCRRYSWNGCLLKSIDLDQARSQDRWGGGTPKMLTFWTQKVDFLNLSPLNPLTKTPFLAHFVTKVDLLADLGALHPHTPMAIHVGLIRSGG